LDLEDLIESQYWGQVVAIQWLGTALSQKVVAWAIVMAWLEELAFEAWEWAE
jgi:hypothetical protein